MKNSVLINTTGTNIEVELISSIYNGANSLFIELICDPSKHPYIKVENGNNIPAISEYWRYEVDSSIWIGSGQLSVYIKDDTHVGVTIYIAKVASAQKNVMIESADATHYVLKTPEQEGGYLPLSGGTMSGALTIGVNNGLKFATGTENANPQYLLTIDAFASGGNVKWCTAQVYAYGNSIVKRDANGYIYGTYFNQSSADESAAFIAGNVGYMVFLTPDNNFFRKVSISNLYDTMHRAYWRNGSASYNFGYTTGNVGSLGGQLISYNSNASGYTRMYASAFNSPSCKFLKENVRDITIEDARKVLDLRPVLFDYKEPYGEKGQQGLIAEEAYEVLPSIVTKGKDWDILDDEHNEKLIKEHFMDISGDIPGIEYSKIVPYLIKLVQDQEKRISELEKIIKEK